MNLQDQLAGIDGVQAAAFQKNRFTRLDRDAVQQRLQRFAGEGESVDEVGIVDTVSVDLAPAVKPGQGVVLRIDSGYFRPAEVETLLGDPTKAKEKLGWVPEITAREMCAEMVAADLKTAQRHALMKEHGFELPMPLENG